MMRILYILLLTFFLAGVFAQTAHFEFNPSGQYEKTVSSTNYTAHKVFIKNLTGGELILGWERLSLDFPEEWEADLCDYVSCYIGIPNSGTMLPIADTTRGFLKITLNPNGFVGTGTVSFKVFNTKHPEVSDTLYFTIHTAVMTDVNSLFASELFKISPNPASDYITIRSPFNEESNVSLINMAGERVLDQKLPAFTNKRLDLSGLPRGLYLLVFRDANGLISKEKVIIQ